MPNDRDSACRVHSEPTSRVVHLDPIYCKPELPTPHLVSLLHRIFLTPIATRRRHDSRASRESESATQSGGAVRYERRIRFWAPLFFFPPVPPVSRIPGKYGDCECGGGACGREEAQAEKGERGIDDGSGISRYSDRFSRRLTSDMPCLYFTAPFQVKKGISPTWHNARVHTVLSCPATLNQLKMQEWEECTPTSISILSSISLHYSR